MKTMSSKKRESSYAPEYEDGSHLDRKKKALDSQFRKKNQREVIDLMSAKEIYDEEDLTKYARYIK